jgi:L-ascorbate oxidase
MLQYSAWCLIGGMILTCAFSTRALADDPCAHLDALYPQPGRSGGGLNAFRPLPLFTPLRPQAGAPGTLSLSIDVDHVSSAPKGKPGYVYVGNYPVTDIPVFKLIGGASGVAQVVNPETGKSVPIPNACIAAPSWGYGGSLWGLVQGDTLDVLLQSRLDYAGIAAVPQPVNGAVPCRASNLHTHGLLVSPYHPARAGLGPYGDYVLDATQPRGSLDYGSSEDDCGTKLGTIEHRGHGLTNLPLHYETTIPGQPGVNSLLTGEHPSGLFWYHPHPHGYSQFQEHGGTTGVITIGQLGDYACPTGDGSPGNCTITNTNVRVLALKDTPIKPFGDGLYATVHDVESDFCSPVGGERHGECQASEGGIPGGKWVFTVNGVEYPLMHAAAGRMEIWRIVNASPSVSYRLIITPAGNPAGASLPFQLLAKDGVGIAQTHTSAAMHSEILVMPATRVEIAIPAPAAGGTYILRNKPAETGTNGSGDIWPAVDLARIEWPKNESMAAAAAVPARAAVDVAGQATPVPHGTAAGTGIPRRCGYEIGDTRVIYFVHRFVTVFGPFAAKDPSGISPTKNEVFGLIAGVRHADGSMDFYSDHAGAVLHSVRDVWNAGVHGTDAAFPGFGHNDYNDVCTVEGNVEHWELQNWTGEDHNFHLHQSRFTIDPNGVFQFPQPRKDDDADLRATDKAVRAFVDRHEVTFNDTVPVPRGQSICDTAPQTARCHGKTTTQCSGVPGAEDCPFPGKMSVLIDFTRLEQVGSFVYHCHILEHEDGGMMAPITVLCPPGNTQCAAQQAAHAPICTTQAAN